MLCKQTYRIEGSLVCQLVPTKVVRLLCELCFSKIQIVKSALRTSLSR